MVSARKKKERRKDFVKTRLKVGKDKAKANNHTDTSFVAKSIHIPNQSIAAHAAADSSTGASGSGSSGTGLGSERLTHYLSLFKHHSGSTRREAVLYVQNQHVQPVLAAAAAGPTGTVSNVGNLKLVLTAVTPLLTDAEPPVRTAALDLLKALPADALAANANFIALYIHAAMTSIDPRVRGQSTLALDAVLAAAPEPLCRVAFVKLVASFIALLGWSNAAASRGKGGIKAGGSVGANSSALVVTTSLDFGKSSTKVAVTHLQSFYKLLAAGLQVDDGQNKDKELEVDEHGNVKLPSKQQQPYITQFLVPSTSMPYLSLALFAKPNDKNNNSNGGSSDSKAGVSITEDVESRVALLRQHRLTFRYGLETTMKQGGEVGRFAKQIEKMLKEHVDEKDDTVEEEE